jgi:homocysteine S-methyltransferase
MKGPLARLLASGAPVILDGAIGTELERRGVNTGLPLWSANALLTSPETLRHIHEEYIRAGADIITTATFRTTRRTFRKGGLADRSGELTASAVSLAAGVRLEFPGRHVLLAGSMGPLEDCYRTDLVPTETELREEHTEHAQRLADAGVDFLLLETMGTVREAYAAAGAARRTGKEIMVSFLCTREGTLYSGESLQEAVGALMPLSPAALSINCVSPRYLSSSLLHVQSALRVLPGGLSIPVAVYANVGFPGGEHSGAFVRDIGPDEYADFAREWSAGGVSIIGGCCGTTPEYIARLRKTFERDAGA